MKGKVHKASSFLCRIMCLIGLDFSSLILTFTFPFPHSHDSTPGRISGLNEEVKEVKLSLSQVHSEKKKLQKKLNDLEKVGCHSIGIPLLGLLFLCNVKWVK